MPRLDPARFPGVAIHESAFVDEPCEIGAGTRIWHFCHVMAHARIGRNCSLGQNVLVASHAVLGDGVKVQNNVSIYTGVELEDGVFCGPSLVFTNVINPRSEIPRRDEFQRTLVRRGATLGANATILCGVEIGRSAFVAAGAVVTKDVPDYALVMGIPARRTGWVCRCGVGLPETGRSALRTCTACGNEYRQEAGVLVPVRETQPG
jgi:UDP-2-acetamido-3-amino-2,3-dideoxy-glucuronate N-acetyltransferase